MSEPRCHDVHRCPNQQQSRRVKVPQVMQTGMREQDCTGTLVMGSDDLAHQSGDRIGV
jgi:hypothetical protein